MRCETCGKANDRTTCPSCAQKPCLKCGTIEKYSKRFDAHYCPTCNEWTERKCFSKDCRFCSKRPARPGKK